MAWLEMARCCHRGLWHVAARRSGDDYCPHWLESKSDWSGYLCDTRVDEPADHNRHSDCPAELVDAAFCADVGNPKNSRHVSKDRSDAMKFWARRKYGSMAPS